MQDQMTECEVVDASPGPLQELLTEAERLMRWVAAVPGSSGILVTRHHASQGMASLDRGVPFGQTVERTKV